MSSILLFFIVAKTIVVIFLFLFVAHSFTRVTERLQLARSFCFVFLYRILFAITAEVYILNFKSSCHFRCVQINTIRTTNPCCSSGHLFTHRHRHYARKCQPEIHVVQVLRQNAVHL